MFNFQVSSFPNPDNLLDDITESSMESHLDDSRSLFKNVFHNPLKDDSQLKEGKSFRDNANQGKYSGNILNNQSNPYSTQTGMGNQMYSNLSNPAYGFKENKLLTDNFLSSSPNQNFAYNKNTNPFNDSHRPNQNYVLQDISVAEHSVNESHIKPIMHNPYGQNQSFNKSNNDVSRSKLDNSEMKSNFVELGQKSRDEPKEYFNMNMNSSLQNQDLNPRPVHLEGNLSAVTEDTQDLSYLSVKNFKNAFPQKDNSYMLNKSQNTESQNKMSSPQQFEHQVNQFSQSPNIASQSSGYRYTGDFGSTNYKVTYSTQPVDLLTMVNANPDPRTPSAYSNPTFINKGFPEKTSVVSYPSVTNYFPSVQTIPKQSAVTENRATETRELQGLLANLESLELSKISAIDDSFDEEDYDHRQSKHRKTVSPKGSPSKKTNNNIKSLNEQVLNSNAGIPSIYSINTPVSKPYEPHFTPAPVTSTYTEHVIERVIDSNVGIPSTFSLNNPLNKPYEIHSSTTLTSTSNIPTFNNPNFNVGYGVERVLDSNVGIPSTFSLNNPVEKTYEIPSSTTLTSNVPTFNNVNFNAPDTFRNVHGHDSRTFGMGLKNETYNHVDQYQSAPTSVRRDDPVITYVVISPPKQHFDQNFHHGSPGSNLPSSTFPQNESYSARDSMKQRMTVDGTRSLTLSNAGFTPQYQLSSTPCYESTGSLNPLRHSVVTPREYHNPFSNTPSSPLIKSASQPRNLDVVPLTDANLHLPSPSHWKTRNHEENPSPTKVVEEAGDIVNKMQTLYKDWKNKNAELNQYMSELSQTSSQNMGERSTYGGKIETFQHNSLNSLPLDQRPRQTMQQFSNHSNFFLNDKYTTPYEFRYSMQNPNSYNCLQPEASREFHAFMKEDLLHGIEQPDAKKIGQVKQKFKTFSNPIFKKPPATDSVPETADENPLSKRDYQRDSMKLINKIFDTSKADKERKILDSAKEDLNLVMRLSSTQSTPKSSREIVQPVSRNSETRVRSVPRHSEKHFEEAGFKPRYKKLDRSRRHDVSALYGDESINESRLDHTLFGIPVKKDKFIKGVDERRIDVNNMEIICINCQEFIKMNEVDRHSRTCDRISRKSHKQFEFHGSESIQDLNGKIQSIKNRLAKKSQNLRLENKVREILKVIDRIITENYNLDNLAYEIQNLERSMDDITRNRPAEQELSVLIYIGRVAVIAKEKYSEIQLADLDEAEIEVLEDRINQYEKETKKQKAELELWKYQAHMMTEIKLSDEKNLRYVKAQYKKDNEVLSQIQSDIDYSERGSSHGGTSVTSGALPFQPDLGVNRSPAENAKSETKKIKFYSMAVNNKLLLPSAHHGKDILISDLYDQCLAQGIPEEKWEEFIKVKLGLRQ